MPKQRTKPHDTPTAAQARARAKMIPKKGFNVVGVDDFERPGQDIFLVKNVETQAEADALRAKKEKDDPGNRYYVYGPNS